MRRFDAYENRARTALRERFAEWEITGDPMVIKRPSEGTFNPFRETKG
jgi:hypothetical protein